MNELTIQNQAVPAYLQTVVAENKNVSTDVLGGVSGRDFLPSLSIKGKNFSVRANGADPVSLNTMSLDVVILAARPTLSKINYPSNYNPKELVQPTCASIDSISADWETDLIDPETNQPCHNCAKCYFNKFGTSTQGAGKHCKDYKRLIVMIASQDGQHFDPSKTGAFILDVPATSLKAPKGTNHMMLRECVTALERGNVPLQAYVITLQFVMSSEYPQLTFRPKRWVMAEEMARINELRGMGEALDTALNERQEKPRTDDEEQPSKPAQPAKQEEPAQKEFVFEPAPAWTQPAEAKAEDMTPAAQAMETAQTAVKAAQASGASDEDVMAMAEAMINNL